MEHAPQTQPLAPTTKQEQSLEQIASPRNKVLRAPTWREKLQRLAMAGLVGFGGAALTDDVSAQNWSNGGGAPVMYNSGGGGWNNQNGTIVGTPKNVVRAAATGMVINAVNQAMSSSGAQVVGVQNGQPVVAFNPNALHKRAPQISPDAVEVLNNNAFDFDLTPGGEYIKGTLSGDPIPFNFLNKTLSIEIKKAGDKAVRLKVVSEQGNQLVTQIIVFGRDQNNKYFQETLK